MKFFKTLYALAMNVFEAIKGPFLNEVKDLSQDMFYVASGKTTKEVALLKEVKEQKRILEAQDMAKEELGME